VRFNYNFARDKLRLIENNEELHVTIGKLLDRIGLRYTLSQFAELGDALSMAEKLRDYVNASNNPRKISLEESRKFIVETYGEPRDH
jgi:alcohol dehydrogenase class IV